ncbi:hypothetical protein EPUL_006843, partial [Erysiphe pulchra]
MDTTPHIVNLVSSLETVTIAQRNAFDKEFKEQFPGSRVDPTRAPDHLELSTFRQKANESLQEYEFRATEIWRRIAEAPDITGVKGIATSIGYSVFVSAFVNGLYDNILRIQAIRQGAATVGTVPEAILAINRAYQITTSEILYSQRADNTAYNALQNLDSLQGNAHAINHASQTQNAAVCFPLVSLPAALRSQFMPLAQITPSQYENLTPSYPRSVPRQIIRNQSILPPPQTVPNTSTHSIYRPETSIQPQANANGYAGPPPPSNLERKPMSHKFVNPRFNPMTSSVPVVNGSEIMGRHCTNCGRDNGHTYRDCPNPSLSIDEKNTLFNKIAKRHNVKFFGTEYPEVRSTQVKYEQFYNTDIERTYGPPRPASPYPNKSQVDTDDEENWPTVRFEDLTMAKEGQSGSGSRSASFFSLLSEPNLNETESLERSSTSSTSKDNHAVDETSRLEPVETFGFSLNDFLSSDELEEAKAISELQIIEGHDSVANSVVVPKGLKLQSIEDIFEQAMLEVQAIEESRKRRRMDMDDMLNGDDDHQFEPRAPTNLNPQTTKRTNISTD